MLKRQDIHKIQGAGDMAFDLGEETAEKILLKGTHLGKNLVVWFIIAFVSTIGFIIGALSFRKHRQ
jgi:hypothetical protein